MSLHFIRCVMNLVAVVHVRTHSICFSSSNVSNSQIILVGNLQNTQKIIRALFHFVLLLLAQVLFNLIFLGLTYYMSGLPHEYFRFGLYAVVGLIVSFVAEGMGLAIGATFSITVSTYSTTISVVMTDVAILKLGHFDCLIDCRMEA